jgi:hypothetical protein
MIEEWKPTASGIYQVSNLGQIRRSDNGKLKTLSRSENGYLIFGHFSNGQRLNILVHRAVAQAFLGKCPDGMEVNHKDGNKLNNRLGNLEYVTRSENLKHATRLGLNKVPTARAVGEKHWTKTHPEAVARGDKNGSRTKPENLSRGEQVKVSKLTGPDVLEIRELHTKGQSQLDIAGQFGVTRRNINEIVNRKSWRHI